MGRDPIPLSRLKISEIELNFTPKLIMKWVMASENLSAQQTVQHSIAPGEDQNRDAHFVQGLRILWNCEWFFCAD